MNISSINPGDIIFATISSLGRVVANLRLSGVTCIDDIIRHFRAGGANIPAAGLVTVSVRNYSAGWSSRQNVILRRA
ncbi:MAG: hypothetical protein NC342_04095 [Pseudoflavonifractor sp.]|nr:hypothetical protein [Alloprevotella sp.]MCM1116697.1 hypothetical protein [Pseudoflavonifractor sp.]